MNIESGIPIPEPPRKRSRWKADLGAMQPGQSSFFEDHGKALSFRAAGYYMGYKMSMRKLEGGWRVWRIA